MTATLRPLPDPRALGAAERRLQVSDLLRLPIFASVRPIGGRAGVHRRVAHVNVMQVPTERYATAGDLVLAADGAFSDGQAPPGLLLAALDARGVAGVAARASALQGSRTELLDVANGRGLPLIELPNATHMPDVLTAALEAIISSQAVRMRSAALVRDQLGGFALSGGELAGLADEVAGVAGCDVTLIGTDGTVLSSSGTIGTDSALGVASAWLARDDLAAAHSDDGWVVWPVLAGGERLGCLVARMPGELHVAGLAALEHGANSAALAIVHQREALNADAQLRERFVTDLLSPTLSPGARRRRVVVLGWASDQAYRVILTRDVRVEPQALAARLDRDTARAVTIDRHRRACVVVLAGGTERPPSDDVVADHLAGLGPDVHVGVSAPLDSVHQLPGGVEQASEALRVAELFDRRVRVRRYAELGALRFLAEMPTPELETFVRDTLAPLDALDAAQRETMLAVLGGLLATGLNVAETARRGGWHYNTVRYRLARLTEALGPFMEDGVRLQSLSLALLLRRELGRGDAGSGGTAQ